MPRSVNSYGVPVLTTFADTSSFGTTPSGQTQVDESERFPSSSTDESGRPRDWTYDPMGALSGASDLGGGPQWGYTYETRLGGQIVWDLQSGDVRLGHREGRAGGDMFTGSNPDRTEAPGLSQQEANSWRRQLTSFTSPEGEVTQRDYDGHGRMSQVTLPWGGTRDYVYGTDGHVDTETLPSGEVITYDHDLPGRMISRSAGPGTDDFATFVYGAGDRMASTTDETGTTTYAYDAAGRFAGMTYPSGGVVAYERDTEDRVAAVEAELLVTSLTS